MRTIQSVIDFLKKNNVSENDIYSNLETINLINNRVSQDIPEKDANLIIFDRFISRTKPTTFQQIKSFTNSVINHTINNFKNVDIIIKQKRLEICKTCEFFNPALAQCQKCGCFLNIKTSWASEKCPLDKWGEEIEIQKQEQQNSVPADCGCNKK